MLSPTAERVIPQHCDSDDARLMYLRHVFAYEEAPRYSLPDAYVLDTRCGEGLRCRPRDRRAGSIAAFVRSCWRNHWSEARAPHDEPREQPDDKHDQSPRRGDVHHRCAVLNCGQYP